MKIWFAFLSLEKIKNNHVLVQHSKMTLNYLRERVSIKGFFMMVSLQASKTFILSIKIRFLVLALGKPFKTQIWHQTLKCCVRKRKKRLKQILCRNKTGCFYVLLTTLLYCTYNYESTIVLYCRKIPSKLRFESHIPGWSRQGNHCSQCVKTGHRAPGYPW